MQEGPQQTQTWASIREPKKREDLQVLVKPDDTIPVGHLLGKHKSILPGRLHRHSCCPSSEQRKIIIPVVTKTQKIKRDPKP